MSIDHYYTQVDGKWIRTNQRVVDGHWETIPDVERPDFRTDFWVDLCHGGGVLIDERYNFPDLAAAMEFYVEGWKDRQYVDNGGQPSDSTTWGCIPEGAWSTGTPSTAIHQGTRTRTSARSARSFRKR